MNADDLRAVAAEIREIAKPINSSRLWGRVVETMREDHYLPSDIVHIAAWHPAVALAVADWLSVEAGITAAGFGEIRPVVIAFVKAWRGDS